MNIQELYQHILVGCMILLAILILVAIFRSIRGPRVADRIIAVNMIGTITMVLFAILAVYLDEDYLGDVCLIYAMISFLAVVVLSKIFTGIYRQKQLGEEEPEPEIAKASQAPVVQKGEM